jgi:hypothetical protein
VLVLSTFKIFCRLSLLSVTAKQVEAPESEEKVKQLQLVVTDIGMPLWMDMN